MSIIGYYGSYVSCGELEGTKYITTIKINDIPQISEWDFGVVNKLKDPNHCTYRTRNYEILSIETLDGIFIDHKQCIPFLSRCIETGRNDDGSASFVFCKTQVIDNFISEIVYYYAFGNSKDIELIKNYSGSVTEYSANGAISAKCELKNGVAKNQIIYYHNNGNIRSIIPIDENGKIHGYYTVYTEHKQIDRIQRYNHGEKDGEEIYHTFLIGYVGFKSKDGKLGIQTIEVYDRHYEIHPDMINRILSSEKYKIVSMEEIDNEGNSKILDLCEIYKEPYKIRRDYTGFVLSKEQVFELFNI
jgi:hypothetical protein